ncbi:MAG: beta-glucosidase [Chloroflexota bacterium]|nr:beta-glucosidase [Chloroflexota bacterium]
MPDAIYRFPEGFLWGTATAAHQVEGGNTNNNWYAWENQPGRISQGHKSGLACDWWGGRWQEDLRNAAEAGQNAHRLSVEWSRIQPAPDRWDEDALTHYREIIQGAIRLGLKPMVTLHHFTDPLWLYERGAWEDDQAPEFFAAFVRKVVGALGDLVDLWVTINEPAVYVTGGYIDGTFPPGKSDLGAAFHVMRNLLKGHAAAYHIIHELQPQAQVGYAKHYRGFEPAHNWFLPDILMANFQSASFNDAFSNALVSGKLRFALKSEAVPEAVGTQDFVGLNYYSLDRVVFKPLAFNQVFSRRFFPKDAELSETGFIANLPRGMASALKWAHQFKLPIYITENGVEDSVDAMRPAYTLQHLHEIWRVANFNWDIRGYFHWSQIDNFEWERGWTQRFGLWGLDVDTQERIRRPSVDLYAAICKENAISSETVRKYAPQVFEKLFPG